MLIVILLFLVTLGLAVGTGPAALGGVLQFRLQADQMVRPGAGVAQDDLPALLAHLETITTILNNTHNLLHVVKLF